MHIRSICLRVGKVSILAAFLASWFINAQPLPPEYRTVQFSDSTYLRPFHGLQFNIPVTNVPSRFVIEDDTTLKFENRRQWTGFLPAYVRAFEGGRQLKVGLTHLFHHRQAAYEDTVPFQYRLRGAGVYFGYDLYSQFFGRAPFVFSWFLGMDVEAGFRHMEWRHYATWRQRLIQANVGVQWGMRWFPTHRFFLELWMEPVSMQFEWLRFNGAEQTKRGLRRGVIRFAAGFQI